MEKKLPKDIENGILLFEKAFRLNDHVDLTKTFKDAIYILNDCTGEFPVYSKDIEELKFANTIRLLCNLKATLPDPEYRIWLEYILLFCIDLKPEIKKLHTSDPSLFENVLNFLSMYKDEITPELKKNISGFLKEIIC